jgi:endonuclease/exonuclease/phosphatase family metal-dependent hydrolase
MNPLGPEIGLPGGVATDRLAQSRRIKEFLDQQSGAKILCGDFNLAQETKSMRVLDDGMRNLINEYGIASTRSSVHYRNYATETHFADYVLVSSGVMIHNFQVPNVHISDHLPMILEFD